MYLKKKRSDEVWHYRIEITNIGDIEATNIAHLISRDGNSIGTTPMSNKLSPGSTFELYFPVITEIDNKDNLPTRVEINLQYKAGTNQSINYFERYVFSIDNYRLRDEARIRCSEPPINVVSSVESQTISTLLGAFDLPVATLFLVVPDDSIFHAYTESRSLFFNPERGYTFHFATPINGKQVTLPCNFEPNRKGKKNGRSWNLVVLEWGKDYASLGVNNRKTRVGKKYEKK